MPLLAVAFSSIARTNQHQHQNTGRQLRQLTWFAEKRKRTNARKREMCIWLCRHKCAGHLQFWLWWRLGALIYITIHRVLSEWMTVFISEIWWITLAHKKKLKKQGSQENQMKNKKSRSLNQRVLQRQVLLLLQLDKHWAGSWSQQQARHTLQWGALHGKLIKIKRNRRFVCSLHQRMEQ